MTEVYPWAGSVLFGFLYSSCVFVTQPGAASINLNEIHRVPCLLWLLKLHIFQLEIMLSKVAKSIPCLSPDLHRPSQHLGSSGFVLPSSFEGHTKLFSSLKVKLFSALIWSPPAGLHFPTARGHGGKLCHGSAGQVMVRPAAGKEKLH